MLTSRYSFMSGLILTVIKQNLASSCSSHMASRIYHQMTILHVKTLTTFSREEEEENRFGIPNILLSPGK